jgi:hypothetical protein
MLGKKSVCTQIQAVAGDFFMNLKGNNKKYC